LFGEGPHDPNFDPDQSKIVIDLPQMPKKNQILNYNLPTSKQKFYPPSPPRLYYELIDSTSSRDEIYRRIWGNMNKYRDVIQYIEQEWDRRLNGVWFFNNGFPVYMSPSHYFYCGYWHLDIGLPSFRDRDWLSWLFWDRIVVPDPLCLGEIYMKHRREGATYRSQCKIYEYTSRTQVTQGGIQSKTEDDARKVFTKHLVFAWQRMPFFFRPIHDGSTDPQNILRFVEPGIRGKAGSDRIQKSIALNSTIGFENSKPTAYDSQKLHRVHLDECGKTTESDVNHTWRIVRTCLTTGAGGKATLTSTVAEMIRGGGKNFKILWEGSDYGERMEIGTTLTGLYRFFLPASLGLELGNGEFINEYGVSDWKKADDYLQMTEKGYKQKGDVIGLNEWKRQYPRNVRMAFRSGLSNDVFNTEIIQRRLEHYTFGNPDVQAGYFERIQFDDWTKGVRWVPDKNSPKFLISQQPIQEIRNKMQRISDFVVPGNTDMYIAGADPFKYNATQGTRRSMGGLAIKSKHNPLIDPQDKPIEEYKTGRFVLDYLYRPATVDEFCEDCLMACIYYGCKMFPEIDVDAIWNYFMKQGAVGYLMFTKDQRNKLRTTPGANTRSPVMEKMFALFGAYIEAYGSGEKHHRILEQCNEVSFDTLTDYDLFTAAGYALVGESYGRVQTDTNQEKLDKEVQKKLAAGFPYEQFTY
jgi:hypothetical protein